MNAEGTPDHEWLMQLVGRWETESHCDQQAEGAPESFVGHEVFRALGDVWVVGEQDWGMSDSVRVLSMLTIGFDTAKGKYVGSWAGSPMTNLVVYEGTREDDVLTLNTESADLSDPTRTAQYQDIIEILGPNDRVFRSQMLQPDGSWKEFMRTTCRRIES